MTLLIISISIVAWCSFLFFVLSVAGSDFTPLSRFRKSKSPRGRVSKGVMLPPAPVGNLVPAPPLVPAEYAVYAGYAKYTNLAGAAKTIDSEMMTLRVSRSVRDFSKN